MSPGCPVQISLPCRIFYTLPVLLLLLTTSLPAQEVKLEKLADGLTFPEGPVWHPDGFLVFSDIHSSTIQRLKPDGGAEPWLSRNFKTNGLILSNDRTRIYAACHSELQLISIDCKSQKIEVLVRDFNGRKFLNMNDVAVDAQGNVYFTDPKWGEKPGDIQGVYRYSPDGKVTQEAVMEKQPNGIAVSPDQQWVYVARTGGNDIWRFKRQPDGTLAEGASWVDLGHGAGPDGMTISKAGVIYQAQAGDGNVTVISPEGKILQRIKVFDRMATNCELVGDDEKTLYVTGGGSRPEKRTGAVYKVTLP